MGFQYANLHSVSLLNPMQQLKRNCAYIYLQNISKFCKELRLQNTRTDRRTHQKQTFMNDAFLLKSLSIAKHLFLNMMAL